MNSIDQELSLRAQVERTTANWNAQLNQIKSALARSEPVQRADMTAYIQRRIAEEVNEIAPELRDYVGGSTPDEVEQSITTAKAKTQSILSAIRQTNPPAPANPQSQGQTPQQYTAEEIAAMSPQSPEFMAARQVFGLDKAGRGHGLYS